MALRSGVIAFCAGLLLAGAAVAEQPADNSGASPPTVRTEDPTAQSGSSVPSAGAVLAVRPPRIGLPADPPAVTTYPPPPEPADGL
ncbi:MAG: hypothetical protein JO305_03570 [Alphaproteobacteria bacterium]|nr:hypothetical protein [Alphaproteobacteria bacterium]